MEVDDNQSSNRDHSSNHTRNRLIDMTGGGSEDWAYTMRRAMQEIVPGLFLGPYAVAMKAKLQDLLDAGITHVICIRQSIEASFIRPNFPQNFKYLVLDIADSPTENIIKHFRQTREFIDDCLNHNGKVLVHGNGGLSRSAAVVIAYVMEKYSVSCREAVTCVRNRRFCISVNDGFLNQLAEYEHIYKAENLPNWNAADQSDNSLKRKWTEDESNPEAADS